MAYDFTKLKQAIALFKNGGMLVVTDDNGRENEGDLVLAAAHCTAEKMAFIIRHSSGIICTPMTKSRAEHLALSPMVEKNVSAHHTAFTISVDYKYNTTTGISASDRTLTALNLADEKAKPEDFLRPGHIFPLIAREGGVLVRSGHTEAAVDLCQLAHLPPVGIIGELVNDDGTVKNGRQVVDFAKKHNLPLITVADLIAYRQRTEILVSHLGTKIVETAYGAVQAHSYKFPWDPIEHVAFVFGDIEDGKNIPVYLYHENIFQNIFGALSLAEKAVSSLLKKQCRGIFLYLRENFITEESKNEGLVGLEYEAHEQAIQREKIWKTVGVSAQILKHLKVSSITLFSLAEDLKDFEKLEDFGIKINQIEIV